VIWIKKNKSKTIFSHLYFQVLLGVLAGIILGLFNPGLGETLKPLGDGFIKLIKMLLAPIIFGTIVVGIAKMGSMKEVGRVGIKALVYFEIVSTMALIIGLVVVNVLQPGAGMNIDPATLDTKSLSTYTSAAKQQDAVGFFMDIIPTSVVDAFAKGSMLQVILFCASFWFGACTISQSGKNSSRRHRFYSARFIRHRENGYAFGSDWSFRRNGFYCRQVRLQLVNVARQVNGRCVHYQHSLYCLCSRHYCMDEPHLPLEIS